MLKIIPVKPASCESIDDQVSAGSVYHPRQPQQTPSYKSEHNAVGRFPEPGDGDECLPLLCPRYGSAMKIIAFIERRQTQVIEKILRHCGLWEDESARSPPTVAGRGFRRQLRSAAAGGNPPPPIVPTGFFLVPKPSGWPSSPSMPEKQIPISPR